MVQLASTIGLESLVLLGIVPSTTMTPGSIPVKVTGIGQFEQCRQKAYNEGLWYLVSKIETDGPRRIAVGTPEQAATSRWGLGIALAQQSQEFLRELLNRLRSILRDGMRLVIIADN